MKELRPHDYVLASKYRDGDPLDGWCVGFYKESYDHFGQERHIVVDNAGNPFRANGYRRCQRIMGPKGEWIVKHSKLIEQSDRSVWYWYRCSMKTLNSLKIARHACPYYS